jgi:hypothetical protein
LGTGDQLVVSPYKRLVLGQAGPRPEHDPANLDDGIREVHGGDASRWDVYQVDGSQHGGGTRSQPSCLKQASPGTSTQQLRKSIHDEEPAYGFHQPTVHLGTEHRLEAAEVQQWPQTTQQVCAAVQPR